MDDIIERRKFKKSQATKRKRDVTPDGDDDSEGSVGEEVPDGGDSGSEDDEDEFAGLEGSEDEEDPLATSDEDEESSGDEGEKSQEESEDEENDYSSGSESEEETQAEKDRKAAFFAPESEKVASDENASFLSMNLSRPIIKSISALGFHKPTPIQTATIPVALLGKDVVGNAVTGSGKTAAFIIPMLERLMYRDRGKNAAATRCLVLVPTRELGVQCLEVGRKLAVHTDIRFCLIVGTLSNLFLAHPLC